MKIEEIGHPSTFRTMDGAEWETEELAVSHARFLALRDLFTQILSTSRPTALEHSCVTIAQAANGRLEEFMAGLETIADEFGAVPPSDGLPSVDADYDTLHAWTCKVLEMPQGFQVSDVDAYTQKHYGYNIPNNAKPMTAMRRLVELARKAGQPETN